MKRTPFAIIMLALAQFSGSGIAEAGEIKLLGSTGVRGTVTELARQFEARSDHKVVMEFDVFAVLKRRIDAGEAFDIAILSPALVEGLVKQGKLAADSVAVVGRTGMGMAVHKGAPKPDISSGEAFKRALLNAKSVGYPKEGASGTHFLTTLDRLGITEEMKGKLRPFEGGGPPSQTFATGEPELVVGGTTLFPAMPGADTVGAFPSELQNYIVFTAAVSASAKEAHAARAFIRSLVDPAALPVLKSKGMEPG